MTTKDHSLATAVQKHPCHAAGLSVVGEKWTLLLLRWTADDTGPAVELFHRDCGEPVTAQLICKAGHTDLGARNIRAVPGPGAISIA